MHIVCPRSSDHFYIVTYYRKWVTTSYTDGVICKILIEYITCDSASDHVGVLPSALQDQDQGQGLGREVENRADQEVQEQTTSKYESSRKLHLNIIRFENSPHKYQKFGNKPPKDRKGNKKKQNKGNKNC